jgi:hypothetical protein
MKGWVGHSYFRGAASYMDAITPACMHRTTTTENPTVPYLPPSSLKRLPSHRIFYGTAGEWVWLRAGLAVRPSAYVGRWLGTSPNIPYV